MARIPTLILSAWPPEIAPLRRLMREPGATGRGHRWVAAEVGVGPVDAGIGAARAIARHRPRRVIFVGTAGSYAVAPTGLAIDAAAIAGDLLCVSTATLRGEGYFPAPQVVRAKSSPALRRALVTGAQAGTSAVAVAVVACPLAITRASALGRQIARTTGAALENLEAFAVARAAAAAKVEFAAVLGVANRVGPSAHLEWRSHHASASSAACRVVAAFLRASRR